MVYLFNQVNTINSTPKQTQSEPYVGIGFLLCRCFLTGECSSRYRAIDSCQSAVPRNTPTIPTASILTRAGAHCSLMPTIPTDTHTHFVPGLFPNRSNEAGKIETIFTFTRSLAFWQREQKTDQSRILDLTTSSESVSKCHPFLSVTDGFLTQKRKISRDDCLRIVIIKNLPSLATSPTFAAQYGELLSLLTFNDY